MSMRETFHRMLTDETGATTVEYGLVASLLAAAVIPVVSGMGVRMSSTFSKISTSMQDAPPVSESASAASSAASRAAAR